MLRVTLKGVRGHTIRFLLTAFAVMIGVAFVAGTFVLRDSINSTLQGLFTTASKGLDVQVRGTGGDDSGRSTLTLGLQSTLEQVPGVARAVPDLQGTAVIAGKDGTAVRSGGAPGLGFAFFPGDPVVDLSQGRAPAAAGEIAVEKRTLELSGLKVGDTTRALIGAGVTPEKIVGEVSFGQGTLFGATAVVVDPETGKKAFAPDGRVETYTVTADKGVSQAQLKAAVEKVLPAGAEARTGQQVNDENQSALKTGLSFVTTFLLAFAGIAVFVGLFIIFNTFSMLAAQRTRELALLRAVGASRGQVMRMMLGEAVVIGLVGSALGIGLGILVAAGAKAALRTFIGIDLSADLPVGVQAVVWSVVVGVVATLVGALLPARRASRTPPIAAMRADLTIAPKGLVLRGTIGLVLLAAGAAAVVVGVTATDIAWITVGVGAGATVLGALVAAPVLARPVVRLVAAPVALVTGVVGRMARENALRVPRRTATTGSALMIGLALVAGFGVVASSTKASVADIVAKELTSDYVLSGGGAIAIPPSVAGAVEKLPQVRSVASVSGVQAQVQTKGGGASAEFAGATKAGPFGDNFVITMVSGQLSALDGTHVLLGETTAKDNGWTTGSTVTMKVGTLPKATYTVGGVFKDLQGQQTSYLVDQSLYEQAVPASQQSAQNIYVKAKPGADLGALRTELAGLVKQYLVISVESGSEFRNSAANGIDTILYLLYALLLFSIVIAVLGIINTLALSVFERTREIGLLRAVGLRRRQLSNMITIEAVTTALFGAVLGTVLGLGLGVALQHALSSTGLDTLAIPWTTVVVVLVASAVIGVLAAVLPAVRAVRLDILRAIATE